MSPTSHPTTSSAARAADPAARHGQDAVVGPFRLAMAALATAALITSFVRTLYTHLGEVNFFSYFTNLSNILGVVVFLIGGLALLRGSGRPNDYLRGAACLYLMVTGAVYWALLANTVTPVVIPWTNAVVHSVMPAAVIMDWLIAPPARHLLRSRALYWLVFPLAYLAYSLIRGPIAQWYPYPFLDPRTRGYAHVAIMSVVVTLVFLLFTVLIVAVGNWLRRDAELSPEV